MITKICTPYVVEFLALEHTQATASRVSFNTDGMYEVTLGGEIHRVSVRLKFQICGIPCQHAYRVILIKKPEDYLCQWFRTHVWRMNYTDGLVTQRGASLWPSTEEEDVHAPPVPAQPGRNKVTKADKKRKKRKRVVNRSPTKNQPNQKKRVMHCGICGSSEHNHRTHDRATTQAASSQQQVLQHQIRVKVQSQSQRSMALGDE